MKNQNESTDILVGVWELIEHTAIEKCAFLVKNWGKIMNPIDIIYILLDK